MNIGLSFPHRFFLCLALVICLTFLLALSTVNANGEGIFYTTQLSDTLPHLAEKYLGDTRHAQSIVIATEQIIGIKIPMLLPPGLVIFIPHEPILIEAIATPPPVQSMGPEPFGKIAFSFYNRALHRRIWEIDIINADGSGRQVLRWNEISEPAISPDGTHISFRGWAADTGHVLSIGPLDTSRHWPLGGFLEDSRPDWSHDGSRLAYASQRESDRLWRMYIIHANGQDEHIISRADNLPLFGEDPAWSYRDDRIIYKGCSPAGDQCGLWFISLDGVVSAPIIVDPTAIQPDGSPSADRVVFASNMTNNWEIYTINIDGSGLQQLTSHPAIDGLPTWSPDGEWIAFQSTRPGISPGSAFERGPNQGGPSTADNWGIWIIRKDGSGLHQIFAFDGGQMKANRLDLPYGSRDWFDEQISWGR